MILDTSALMAILQKEAEAPAFGEAAAKAETIAIAAPTLVELGIVAEGLAGEVVRPRIDQLLESMRVEIVPFTAEHAALARDAWRRYGKGRHPAGLNLGDCFAYALAVARDEPLLFKGDDFARTDVKAAI
ncbi:type II toxin-antitoxin system VapC family toxin [Roseomonas fluvialis]|uniref:Ribonuclease VapC n=1 Tax=Roseomonas fluvialis TaxID=1750527 RepID=A0ABN6P5I1_9PROT|nr:type II toxin-antitoxin system VapC family toxin [Roseomonas fluvialis]BDG73906.1 ribonuclease VapC [Roseomonas fluvialis]